ncbi:hypothetical protein FQN60_011806 [Etheostoma spectabile]|uniref:Uncharacterized protein n=1 Tax=Etheostoma spectabile TaxID=54343 RepID=A0A5J5DMP3_9PERO|nr:hypothetical protein FQN60_011806 [Etheostoma spectabile]
MPAHLSELTRLLPHYLSRRTKCAVVSWQSSPKCQPGVTNPCRPLGPHRPGSVGCCPGSDMEPGTCHARIENSQGGFGTEGEDYSTACGPGEWQLLMSSPLSDLAP